MNKALLIISGVMLVALVSAGIIYHYQSTHTEFNKSIEATVTHGGGGGGGGDTDVYTSVVASGDVGNTSLVCSGQDTCSVSTDTITLTSSDVEDRNCTVSTTGDSNVVVAYSFGSNPITVPANGAVSFTISYTTDTTGTYNMQTAIDC